jgi:hypothetical protein
MPEAGINERILPEYKPFFDSLEKEYLLYNNINFEEIVFFYKYHGRYPFPLDRNGNILETETEVKCIFADLLNSQYEKYRTSIFQSQYLTSKDELMGLVRNNNWDRVFQQMYYITKDAIYYSISKLNPQMHEVNMFFVNYFTSHNDVRHEHEKLFSMSYTFRSPFFRGSLIATMSNRLDELERSPLFVMFMFPPNLTSFGEERLSEVISIFAEKMQEYEDKNGTTAVRICYTKLHKTREERFDQRKLKNIIQRLVREAENELRERHGLREVGQGWIQETILLHKIKSSFPNYDVIHQGKPSWLGNQRIDIWIPQKKIAIEYNGQQHYVPVGFFGGVDGLRKTQELDARKAALCIKNGVRLFIIRYDEDMDASVARIKAETRVE